VDNVTHTLAGLLIADGAVLLRERSLARSRAEFVVLARLTSAIAANLPDLDFLYARRLTAGKLGYLLHHRGHTHTLLLGLAGGVLVYFLARLARHRVFARLDASERRWLFALCALGPLLHIAMDFSNNYGVHPFWPLVNGWYYGDSIFIVEPWFFVFVIPEVFFASKTRVAKWLLAAVLVIALILAWVIPYVPWGVALALSAAALACLWFARALSPPGRWLLAVAGTVVTLATFAGGSAVARAAVAGRVEVSGSAKSGGVQDIVISPTPGNPLCFSSIAILDDGDRYELRAGTVAVLPSLLPAERCRVQPTGLSLGLDPPRGTNDAVVHWDGDYGVPVARLANLARTDCRVAAFFRFARAPFVRPLGERRWLIGDLRFDRDPQLDFSEFELSPGDPCPTFVPPWREPRRELWEGR
jgi:inner membrane protein